MQRGQRAELWHSNTHLVPASGRPELHPFDGFLARCPNVKPGAEQGC